MRISFTMSYKQWTNRDKLFNVAHEFFTEESAIESYWFLSACYQLLHLVLSNKSELKYLFYTDSKMINLVRHYLCDQIRVFIYRECFVNVDDSDICSQKKMKYSNTITTSQHFIFKALTTFTAFSLQHWCRSNTKKNIYFYEYLKIPIVSTLQTFFPLPFCNKPVHVSTCIIGFLLNLPVNFLW